VKSLAMEHLVNKWDHAFLVYEGDVKVREFLDSMAGHKTVVLDRIPTVENMAAVAFGILAEVYDAHYGVNLKLKRVRLYETPNCWADVERA
jgi:6-pyruvoyltetrahydropterin/6-carboxytetrahydropterin synthase